jgi:hypothetical protein
VALRQVQVSFDVLQATVLGFRHLLARPRLHGRRPVRLLASRNSGTEASDGSHHPLAAMTPIRFAGNG